MCQPSFHLFRPPLLPRGEGAFACLRDGALLLASYVRFRSNARKSIGTMFAMTRTAGPEKVRYSIAILKCSASLNYFHSVSVFSDPHGVRPHYCALQQD